ncbi:MAG: hypothetical protein FAZ92_02717 [Accumulibacter sp.]|nr:MAG: hypothetical protein FAZ92_02717 [Accumulibacter sp.]
MSGLAARQPHWRRWRVPVIAGIASLAFGLAAGTESGAVAQVEVRRDGEAYSVHASGQLAAGQRIVWDTLTDYERLREFVPGVRRARVLERQGNRLLLEQAGVFTVFFFELPVQLRLDVLHLPYTTVMAQLAPADANASDGSTLRSFSGRYRIRKGSGGLPLGVVQLEYDARFELATPLPPLVGALFGVAAVRQTMRAQFEAMLREIERRQQSLAGVEPPG